MNDFQKQSGIAHIFIMLIIVVALLGIVGFVFWNSFVKNSSDSTNNSEPTRSNNQQNTPEKDAVAESTGLVDKELMTSDNFGIKYKIPSSWSGGNYGGGDSLADSESTTLTSPDGFVITMTISRLIRGWTYDSPVGTVLDAQKTTGTSLNWMVIDHADGPINLEITDVQTPLAVGDTKVVGSSIYKLGEANGLGVYLEMYGGYKTDMTLADFNAKESVKQAKAIFESVSIGL